MITMLRRAVFSLLLVYVVVCLLSITYGAESVAVHTQATIQTLRPFFNSDSYRSLCCPLPVFWSMFTVMLTPACREGSYEVGIYIQY